MSSKTVRTHIVIPKSLLDTIDELVGQRARSRFFAEAAEKELRRRNLIQAAKTVGGSLEQVDILGWETSESAAEWVRAARRVDQAARDRSLTEP